MFQLTQTKNTDPRLKKRMEQHYSAPKGFVGRNICYAVTYNGFYYGHIVGGSAIRHLPKARHEFLNTDDSQLNNIVNNCFFNISPLIGKKYPLHNFTSLVIKEFIKKISIDWEQTYGDKVLGFETLVEKPRNGELYLKAGWTKIGETKGYTCKRVGGRGKIGWYCELIRNKEGELELMWRESKQSGLDSYTGKRNWNKDILRPKDIFCFRGL